MPYYAVAREFLERALAAAEARHRTHLARNIRERLCEVIEQEDFDECHQLDVVPVIQSEWPP